MVGQISKAGLKLRVFVGGQSTHRVDIFNETKLMDGSKKLLIQDIDSLLLSNGPVHKNFDYSAKNLLDVVCSFRAANSNAAKKIIEKARKEMRIS
mgnify:CR=1 FL=1